MISIFVQRTVARSVVLNEWRNASQFGRGMILTKHCIHGTTECTSETPRASDRSWWGIRSNASHCLLLSFVHFPVNQTQWTYVKKSDSSKISLLEQKDRQFHAQTTKRWRMDFSHFAEHILNKYPFEIVFIRWIKSTLTTSFILVGKANCQMSLPAS